MRGDGAPQQIEAQIAASRAELGAILDRIERKLIPTPRQLLHRGVEMLKERGSAEAPAGESNGARNHTVPLALVGLGLGWLLLSRGEEAQPHPTEAVDHTQARLDPGAPSGQDETASNGPEHGRFGAAMADHPLALGALAFLAGAAISLLLPRATVERAQHLAERAAEAAAAMVKNAVGDSGEV